MNELTNREKLFVKLMFDETEYKPVSYYAQKLDVSTKTLHTDLKNIREYLKTFGDSLSAGTGKGILLDEKARNHRELRNQINKTSEMPAHQNSGNMKNQIVKELLLNSNGKTSIQKLSDKFFVSKTSIVNCLNQIESWLQKYNLKLIRSKKGTFIEGDEINIRKAIAGHTASENTRNGLLEIFSAEDIDFIEALLSQITSKDNDMGDIYYSNLLTHILICIKRVQEDNRINDDSISKSIDMETIELFQKAIEIAEKVNERYDIDIGKAETYYIYKYLISFGINRKKMKKEQDAGTLDICTAIAHEMTETLSKKFGIDFQQEKDLMEGLILHIRPMMNRLDYNIQVFNPMKDEFCSRYPEMVKVCSDILNALFEKYSLGDIGEDEVANIAIYYQTILEKISMKRKILVVCHSGYGTSQLLVARLQNEFAFLEIVDAVSSRKVETMDLKGIDYIISTVPIHRKDVPYLIISALLSEEDIRTIRRSFYHFNRGK